MIGSIWELARGGSIWELRHVAPKLRGQLVSAAPPRRAGRERSPRALQRGVGRLPRPSFGNAVPPAPPLYPPYPRPLRPRSDMRAWSRDMLAGLTLALAPRRSPEAYGSPAHRQRCSIGPFITSSRASPRPCGCPSCSLSGAAAVDGQRCPHGAATAGQSRRGGRAHARGRTGAALGQDRGLEGPREGRAVGLPPTGLPGLLQPDARGWAGHAKCASGGYAARASGCWQLGGCGVDRGFVCANAAPPIPSTFPLFA